MTLVHNSVPMLSHQLSKYTKLMLGVNVEGNCLLGKTGNVEEKEHGQPPFLLFQFFKHKTVLKSLLIKEVWYRCQTGILISKDDRFHC